MQDTSARPVRTSALWFGLIAAPLAWSVHMLVVWLVVEAGCALGLADIVILGINGVYLLVLLSTLAAGVVSLASGVVAYQNWQRLQQTARRAPDAPSREVERGRFMTVVGMSFSALFLLVIFYMAIPVFVLPAC